ncbi:hypothetical protein LUW76_41020 [Actinomadura madurae]|uniref:hypothetical protein n=1 Tax=Actinomadura madurae TaxID=1993 RepID=UPI0020262FB4|nr:hypothetical protein [Actinomadura madurae]URN00188.1 hypothetical protein LUW76_41020 [Actinomadura madurae]
MNTASRTLHATPPATITTVIARLAPDSASASPTGPESSTSISARPRAVPYIM